jgi:glycosyltransferase involved in cell wall biosynthesis
VVLHAPSRREVKGTRFVLEAIARLQATGVPCELVLVEGRSHAEACRLYARADLLVDQLLVGWYGAVAVELMALGKPVVCYIREEDLERVPPHMRQDLPVINATPATIYKVLRRCLTTDRHALSELGRRGRSYVEKWHDPRQIAARLKGDYEQIAASKQQTKNP